MFVCVTCAIWHLAVIAVIGTPWGVTQGTRITRWVCARVATEHRGGGRQWRRSPKEDGQGVLVTETWSGEARKRVRTPSLCVGENEQQARSMAPGRRRLLVTLLICGRCSPLYCSLFLALPVFVQTLPCSFIMQPLFPCASRACYPRLAMLNQ